MFWQRNWKWIATACVVFVFLHLYLTSEDTSKNVPSTSSNINKDTGKSYRPSKSPPKSPSKASGGRKKTSLGEQGGGSKKKKDCKHSGRAPVHGVSRTVSPVMKLFDAKTENMGLFPVFKFALNNAGLASDLAGRVIIDVGMHDGGDYSIPALKLGMIVYAFEVMPDNRKRAEANLKAAGLAHLVSHIELSADGEPMKGVKVPVITDEMRRKGHIFLIHGGASAARGSLTIGHSGGGEMDGLFEDPNGVHVGFVPITDIVPPDEDIFLLKTDTEGHDFQVLLGAHDLFASGQIKYITLEYNPKQMGRTLQVVDWAGPDTKTMDPIKRSRAAALATLDLLVDAGYSCFDTSFNNHIVTSRPSDFEGFVDSFLNPHPDSKCTGPCLDWGLWDELFCISVLE